MDIEPAILPLSEINKRKMASGIWWSTFKKTLFIIGSASIVFVALSNSLSYQLQRFWGASGSFWQHQWDKVLLMTNNDPFTLVVYGSIFVSYGVFWCFGFIYTFMDLTGWPHFIKKYKIQPGANEPMDIKHLIKVILVVHFNQTVVLFFTTMFCYNIIEFRGWDKSRTLPKFHWVIFELIIFILVEEIIFYYSHRLFHHRMFYKFFHKIHHEWQAPIAITSIYAHPLEHCVSNLLPVFAGPILMGSHVATMWLWSSLAILSTLNAHSGYHLPFFPSPEAHDFHHLKFNQCFGVLGILDFLHGTDDKFRASKNFQRHIMMLSFTPPRDEFPDIEFKNGKKC